MPLKKTEVYDNTGLLLDNYDTSVKMSTYLVAFVVCDFANISKTTSDGVKVCGVDLCYTMLGPGLD